MRGKKISLKYEGKCRECGAALAAGETAYWYGKGKVYGIGCHSAPKGKDAWRRKLTRENPGLIILGNGTEIWQNPKGRCEDAPCCGCCTG